jgi:hypothetical protein
MNIIFLLIFAYQLFFSNSYVYQSNCEGIQSGLSTY